MENILINIDSRYRDQTLYPNETKYKINFEKTYKNIISARMVSMEITNTINYIDSKKEAASDKLGDKKSKIDGLKLIATLKIEGYFKDENQPDESKVLTEKVNLGAILKQVVLNDGSTETKYDTYEGLKTSYLNDIPSDVDKNKIGRAHV